MAERLTTGSDAEHHLSGTTVFYASLSSLAIGGPLLCMMSLTLLASTALLLVASPLLLLCSPVLIPAALVLAAAIAGFGAAAAMSLSGLAAIGYVCRSLQETGPAVVSRVMETLTESGQRLKKQAMDVGGYIQQKVEVQPPENRIDKT